MKLRIRGQELRYRLDPEELTILLEQGVLENSIHIGPEPDQRLVFGLISSTSSTNTTVIYEKGHVAIVIPVPNLQKLNQESISHTLAIEPNVSLTVVVELDQPCVHGD